MRSFSASAGLCGLGLALAMSVIVGCSSTGSKVLERADDISDRPDWATVTTPSWEDNGKKYFVGYVELDGDVSKSGALNMADEKALSEPMRALVDQFLDQNQVGEDLRKEGSIGQRVISATRGYRPPMPALTIVKRYWETVAPNGPDGAPSNQYTTLLRAYSLAEIPLADFEKAKHDYFQHLAGNSQMKVILGEVGQKQRDNILNAENTAKDNASQKN